VLAGDLDGQLIGKTPGEALATIMNILYQIKSKEQLLYQSARDKSLIRQMTIEEAQSAGSEGDELSQELQKKLDDPTANWFQPNDPAKTLNKLSTLVASAPQTGTTSALPPNAGFATQTYSGSKCAQQSEFGRKRQCSAERHCREFGARRYQ
jgi:hypothetical protein